ncbi:antigen 5 like allergen Cul n 1-like [Anastrepha obliqua]|uniref:antigen 5 like allergen Cul n 1-like n=1 Tax=Anastrepha obliqua TaxID=95512 RepID=UPI0024095780|nr:antigen 5 like allergen Cul n 1-like [Anastrepha obliqua]
MHLYIFLILLVALPFKLANAYFYCGAENEKKLCKTKKHIICHPDTLPLEGEVKAFAPMTNKLKRMFLDHHNEFRNKLAGGQQEFKGGEKFPNATRMREVLWDDELAYIAGEHAKRCHMAHDECRSTERFPSAGQNLHSRYRDDERYTNVPDVVLSAVNDWWGEYSLVEDGNKLTEEFPGGVADWHKIGHFTAMANERAAFVGCGVAFCDNCTRRKYCVMVSCNYSKTNVLRAFMYKTGDKPASACDYYETTPSQRYPNLCINNGKFYNKVR